MPRRFSVRPQVVFLAAAVDQRPQSDAVADGQRPDALGSVQLLSGERHQVRRQAVEVEGQLARGLAGIGVERDAGGAGDHGNLLDGLDDARLIVGVHDRDQPGVRPQLPAHVFGIDPSATIDRQVAHLMAQRLQESARRQDGRVFDLRRDDVDRLRPSGLAAVPPAEQRSRQGTEAARLPLDSRSPGDSLDGQIVRLGAGAGEDNFLGLGVDQIGHLSPRLLHQLPCLFAEGVQTGWVAKNVQVPNDSLFHFRGQGRGGVVVEVDGTVHVSTPFLAWRTRACSRSLPRTAQ
jgi:hypothetical protein